MKSMHSYATNTPQPIRLIAVLAFISVLLSAKIGLATSQISNWGIHAGSLSTMGTFWILWLLFDHFAWKWAFVRRFLLVPDLNGTWACSGRTHKQAGKDVHYEWDSTIRIVQSWSKIRIVSTTNQSPSHSITASLCGEAGAGYRLIYYYDNTPNLGEPELQRHSGLANLLFDETKPQAEGQYFSDGNRQTIGTMSLTRMGTKS